MWCLSHVRSKLTQPKQTNRGRGGNKPTPFRTPLIRRGSRLAHSALTPRTVPGEIGEIKQVEHSGGMLQKWRVIIAATNGALYSISIGG